MTNRAILDIIYETLKASQEADMGVDTDQIVKEQIDFIEREWQKQDGEQESLTMKMLSENPSKKWYTDVRDMERHRGLEIGPDGTVTGIKDSPSPKWVKEDWHKSYEPTKVEDGNELHDREN